MKKHLFFYLLLSISFLNCSKDDDTSANYTNFKITKVTLSKMPFTDSNSVSWDNTDGPDVFYNMEDQQNNVLSDGSGSRFNNVTQSSLPLNWTYSQAYQITNLDFTHYVTFYDYDNVSANDLIGYVGFTLSDHKNGYPTSITKSSNGLTVTIQGVWY